MACHEISGLRLGFMNVLEIEDEAEKKHELDELGESIETCPEIRNLVHANTLPKLLKYYQDSLSLLEQKFSKLEESDPKRAYYQSLLILNKKVELELERSLEGLNSIYNELEEMHDYVHEVFPVGS